MSRSSSIDMGEENIQALEDLEPVANGWGRDLTPRANESRPLGAYNSVSPSHSRKETEQLLTRDTNAVNYSKSLLEHGDTLVIIRYPNNQKVYDATGFEIRDKHRVHSEKLLATGSAKLKHMLEDEWCQHRAKRRNKLIGNMPPGVNYVLDLTPPEEGDDALELTSELSCPPGILRWRNAAARIGVAKTLIGGKDETTIRPEQYSPTKETFETGMSPHAQAVSEVLTGNTTPFRRLGSGRGDTSPARSVWEDSNDTPLLDYDPIRHRTGIERLLQVIEGKDPRIDSAPKVWNLAVLAKHFECNAVVMDFIFTWLWVDPNCRIIETLPEDCIRIGMMIQSPRLVRTAFSILVSEEALKVGTEHHFDDHAEIQKKVNGYRPGMTRFGRIRESLDEDTVNSIQHAGRHFAARVDAIVANLLDPEMKWLHDMPEFAKLKSLLDHIVKHNERPDYPARQRPMADLENELLHYVRGRLLWCFIAQLEHHQLKRGDEHRLFEAWKCEPGMSFMSVYDSLRDKERIMTRFFWEIIRNLDWGLRCTTNLVRDSLPAGHPFFDMQHAIADANGVRKVTNFNLAELARIVNKEVLDAIQFEKYNGGTFPNECYQSWIKPSSSPKAMSVNAIAETLDEWSFSPDDPDFSGVWADGPLSYLRAAQSTTEQPGEASSTKAPSTESTPPVCSEVSKPHIPYDERIDEKSPFFSLPTFFRNVNSHIQTLCAKMLDNGENEWSTTCDTLLCLDDNEYKFLPLYAGGLDDGSGGVFEDVIPAADKGPSGPGPAFHTGSTMGSHASSLASDWDAMSDAASTNMGGVDSSLGVEDGFSEDHVDRRVGVKSEEDFPVALPIRGVDNDKGKEKEKEVVGGDGDVMDDDFFDTPDDTEEDFDLVDIDEGDVTE